MDFGKLLRKKRKEADKTLRATSDHIGVSVPYLSDVELGRRKPFQSAVVVSLAEFLNADKDELLQAAATERQAVTIQSERGDVMQAAVGLARGELTDDDLKQILEIINRGKK